MGQENSFEEKYAEAIKKEKSLFDEIAKDATKLLEIYERFIMTTVDETMLRTEDSLVSKVLSDETKAELMKMEEEIPWFFQELAELTKFLVNYKGNFCFLPLFKERLETIKEKIQKHSTLIIFAYKDEPTP